jgi:tetraacyldisaccharide-1-P 4'-kinase
VSQRTVVPVGAQPPAIDDRIARLLPAELPVFASHLEPLGVISLQGGDSITPQAVHVCTAIANPEGFFASLERIGFTVNVRLTYPDHYDFSDGELRDLLKTHADKPFVCTPKDAVKIARLGADVGARFYVLQTRAAVVPFNEFFASLERLLQNKSASTT